MLRSLEALGFGWRLRELRWLVKFQRTEAWAISVGFRHHFLAPFPMTKAAWHVDFSHGLCLLSESQSDQVEWPTANARRRELPEPCQVRHFVSLEELPDMHGHVHDEGDFIKCVATMSLWAYLHFKKKVEQQFFRVGGMPQCLLSFRFIYMTLVLMF